MNKKYIYVFITLFAIITLTYISFMSITNTTSVASQITIPFKPTIIIDAGHGGEDGGASVNNSVLEKNINLEIAKKLKVFLQSNGFKVIMTRSDDNALSDVKRKDLQRRVDIFNSSSDNIVLSIHQNKFEQSQYHGAQVFFSANDIKSKNLANCIQLSVKKLLQPDNNRSIKKAGSEIFILDNCDVPSVLIECGFLSNETELKKLLDESYQNKIAYSIFLGFMEFYYTNYN